MKLPASCSPFVPFLDADVRDVLCKTAQTTAQEKDAFFVCDQTEIERKACQIGQVYANVRPYFDVYANSHPIVLSALSALDFGFLCRNKVDLGLTLDLGVDPKRILFCPPPGGFIRSHLKLAAANDVGLVGFRSEADLNKIAGIFPDARLLLCTTLSTFEESKVAGILKAALQFDMNLVGVSVLDRDDLDIEIDRNNGENEDLLDHQMKIAKIISQMSIRIGLDQLEIVDVGHMTDSCSKANLKNCLRKHFGPSASYFSFFGRIGAELTQSAFWMATKIQEKKCHYDQFSSTPYFSYGISEMCQSLFVNGKPNELDVSTIRSDNSDDDDDDLMPSVLVSPQDQVLFSDDVPLPSSLLVGDWIVFGGEAVTPCNQEQFTCVKDTVGNHQQKFWILMKGNCMEDDDSDDASFGIDPEL